MLEVLKNLFYLFKAIMDAIIGILDVVLDIKKIKKIAIAELIGVPVYIISIIFILIFIATLLACFLVKHK